MKKTFLVVMGMVLGIAGFYGVQEAPNLMKNTCEQNKIENTYTEVLVQVSGKWAVVVKGQKHIVYKQFTPGVVETWDNEGRGFYHSCKKKNMACALNVDYNCIYREYAKECRYNDYVQCIPKQQ